MKTLLRSLAAAAAFLALVTFLAPTASAALVAQRITIQFKTLEDGKGPGSAVSVFVHAGGEVVARNEDFARGALAGNSTSGEFTIPIVRGPVTAEELREFRVSVHLQAPPGKTDAWKFDFVIRIHMSNGGVITREAKNVGLKSVSGGAAVVSHDFRL